MRSPTPSEVRRLVNSRKANATCFRDVGLIPNNPHLPFIHYRGAVRLAGGFDPAAVFERLFKLNGWGGAWRNGMIYDYIHYHPRTHEVLGIARGRAHARFGGKTGKLIRRPATSSFSPQEPGIRP
jgi:uncharacterized protein YjlB